MTIDTRVTAAWMKAGFDLWMLGAEVAAVMTLRTVRIAAGGSAGAVEAELMVSEKVRAGIELQTRLMTGALDFTPLGAVQGSVTHYRRKVAANWRRLSRG